MKLFRRMKMMPFGLYLFISLGLSFAQTEIWKEDFENPTPEYTITPPEQSDGSGDFFTRTNGTGIGSFVVYTGFTDFYFAAMDTDADAGGSASVTLEWSNINITGESGLAFCGLFAEDDDGSNQDWDSDSSVKIDVQVDSGNYVTVLAFEASGGTNTEPREDTDFDGIGDGQALTPAAQEFCGTVAATGSTMSIRVTIANLDAGDEDIAFDDLRVVADFVPPAPAPPSAMPSAMPSSMPAPPMQAKIHEVQGNGTSSLLVGMEVEIEGVVVGDFQDGEAGANGDLNGFFLQEETADEDGDPATSEGIFVFDRDLNPAVDVMLYQTVKVVGIVSEFRSKTQITPSSIEVMSSGTGFDNVTKAVISLGGSRGAVEVDDFEFVANLEAYESMLVEFPQKLFITEMFNLDRFGQVALSEGDPRPYQFTQLSLPNETGYVEHLKSVAAKTVFFDDGQSTSNPDPVDLFGFNFNTLNFLRMGDSVEGLTGVLDYSFDEFRVHAVDNSNTFVKENLRPDAPPSVGGTLKVVSFNVLNYFVTLDDRVNDICGPEGDLGCRGANNQEEFDRQQQKTATTLAAIDADIVGLIEIENDDGDIAALDIVDQLSNITGRQYTILSTGAIGEDAIRVGLIYDALTVETTGLFGILNSTVDGNFSDTRNRPVLVQTFTELSTGGTLTVAVCHFKSKGSSCSSDGDLDTIDGSGNCDGTRSSAATALARYLASDPISSNSPSTLIIGDLNSYAMERPIMNLISAGFTDLEQLFAGETPPYGYVFDGQLGTLDYALSNPSLTPFVVGAQTWHINADEADLLDYNTDFTRNATLFDGSVPFRSSDHDPVIVGISFPVPSLSPSAMPLPATSLSPSAMPLPVTSLLPSAMPLPVTSLLPSAMPLPATSLSPSAMPLPVTSVLPSAMPLPVTSLLPSAMPVPRPEGNTAEITYLLGPVSGELSSDSQNVVEQACDNRLTALLGTFLVCEFKSQELVTVTNDDGEEETFVKVTMDVFSTPGAAGLSSPFALGQAIETILNGDPAAFVTELKNVAAADGQVQVAFFMTVTTLQTVVSSETTAAPSTAPTPAPTPGPMQSQSTGEIPFLLILGTAAGLVAVAAVGVAALG